MITIELEERIKGLERLVCLLSDVTIGNNKAICGILSILEKLTKRESEKAKVFEGISKRMKCATRKYDEDMEKLAKERDILFKKQIVEMKKLTEDAENK